METVIRKSKFQVMYCLNCDSWHQSYVWGNLCPSCGADALVSVEPPPITEAEWFHMLAQAELEAS